MSADREHEHSLPLAGEREALILRRAGTTTRINALFKAMATDVELRERFIKDPAQVLSEHVESKPLPPQQASVTNQLLYSVLSNPKLLEWLANYGREHRKAPPPRQVFMADFSRAVVEYGGNHVVLSLLRGLLDVEGVPAFGGPSGAFFITSSPIIASGIIFSTDQQTSIPQDQRSSQNFNQSSNYTQTPTSDQSTSTSASGTESDTSSSTESDTSSSTESDTSSSTESDTSSSTESDTGTGSETGTGTAGVLNILVGPQYVRVTIDAMVRYATELLNAGVLDTIGITGGAESGA